MVSQTLEYALRAVVTLAQHAGQPRTSQQIAQLADIPAPYLSKLMRGLVRADIVSSQRGLGGGFLLTRQPTELTIWDVAEAVDPLQRIHRCPLSIASHGEGLCPLHRRLDAAMALVEEQFRGTTIAEVLSEPGATTPLCQESPHHVEIGGV
jgi:Rrf2 family protein